MTVVRQAYPGPASFQDSDKDRILFHGRGDEKRTLLDLVIAENLVLLFARSGMGKTSLINAGLMQQLRDSHYFPVVVRVIHDEKNGPIASVIARFQEEAQRLNVQLRSNGSAKTLWNFFADTEFFLGEQPLVPVLILDQFEEIFTRVMTDGAAGQTRGEQFVQQLADVVRRRMPDDHRSALMGKLSALEVGDPERKRLDSLIYRSEGIEAKVVVSIREDFLPELEAIKTQLPDVFRSSFRLEPLNRTQARDAIVNPGQQAEVLRDNTFTFADGVVDEMIEFLARQRAKGQWRAGDQVDPHLLQILCQHANRRALDRPDHVVQRADLGGATGMQRIVRRRYDSIVRHIPRFRGGWSARRWKPSWDNWLFFHTPRKAVRRLCEEKLITSGGHRNSREVVETTRHFGVARSDLNVLVDEKLLRREERLGTDFYELRHDTWIETCQAAQQRRRMARIRNIVIAILFLGIAVIGRKEAKTEAKAWWWRHRLSVQSLSSKERTDYVMKLAELGHSRLKDVRLADADFRHGNLNSVDFSEARLPKPDFAFAFLFDTNFDHAEIEGANFPAARIILCDFGNALLSASSFSFANIEDTKFQGATLAGADFTAANMVTVDFTAANLRNTTWDRAELKRADFTNAYAADANFENTNLNGADLTNADLSGADFDYTSAKDVHGIETANLSETNWCLLKGLTDNTVREFSKRWPLAHYQTSEAASRHLQRRQDGVQAASTDKDCAVALNNVAWFRVVSGLDLNTAREEVDESIRIQVNVDNLDTLGYIQLLSKQYEAAASSFTEASAEPKSVAEYVYHLALALDYQGKEPEARERYKDALQLGYEPSYERVLSPARITLTTAEIEEVTAKNRATGSRDR